MANELEKLVQKSKAGLKKLTQKSLAWFKRTAEKAFKSRIKQTKTNQWILQNLEGADQDLLDAVKMVKAPMIGHMYFYAYDPKWKVELPYYDTFPLVIPINYAKGGFLGLNFHYLPPQERARLLDQLMKFRKNIPATAYGEKKYLNLSYQLLGGLANTAYKPTIKRYLFSHFRSGLAQVGFDQWENALFLPVESFRKESKQAVWKESKRYY